MRDTDNPDGFADEVPVADAVEQEQETTPEPGSAGVGDAPIEADPGDWQEQRHEVVGAYDDGRDDYPEGQA